MVSVYIIFFFFSEFKCGDVEVLREQIWLQMEGSFFFFKGFGKTVRGLLHSRKEIIYGYINVRLTIWLKDKHE